jgi:hypothetical protein
MANEIDKKLRQILLPKGGEVVDLIADEADDEAEDAVA